MNNDYPILPKWKLLFAIALSIPGGLLLIFIIYPRYGSYSIMCSLPTVALFVYIALMSNNVVLFTFEDGIQYRNGSALIEAKWNDLTEIREKRLFYFWKQSGIFISSPTRNEIEVSGVMKLQYSLDNPIITRKQSAFIPLSWFADNWRDSEIGQQIKQHAPHLFK